MADGNQEGRAVSGQLTCTFPGCTNGARARGRRGPNSPVLQAGGDKSHRYKFCTFHQKGKGKADRVAWQAQEGGDD